MIPPNPGAYSSTQKALTGLGNPENFRDLPKANPASDPHFQQDAAAMIAAIKATNPDALVIVAGHSMGADAVARLGRNRSLPIDLLAVIDPGNNQDSPRGFKANPLDVTHRTFNWTRWRATHLFRGFRQWDCVRNNVGLCRDFDSRFFHVRFECGPVGPFLETQPLLPSRAPIACPALVPYIAPGTTHSFGANIKHLYHRWAARVHLSLRLPPDGAIRLPGAALRHDPGTELPGADCQECPLRR